MWSGNHQSASQPKLTPSLDKVPMLWCWWWAANLGGAEGFSQKRQCALGRGCLGRHLEGSAELLTVLVVGWVEVWMPGWRWGFPAKRRRTLEQHFEETETEVVRVVREAIGCFGSRQQAKVPNSAAALAVATSDTSKCGRHVVTYIA